MVASLEAMARELTESGGAFCGRMVLIKKVNLTDECVAGCKEALREDDPACFDKLATTLGEDGLVDKIKGKLVACVNVCLSRASGAGGATRDATDPAESPLLGQGAAAAAAGDASAAGLVIGDTLPTRLLTAAEAPALPAAVAVAAATTVAAAAAPHALPEPAAAPSALAQPHARNSGMEGEATSGQTDVDGAARAALWPALLVSADAGLVAPQPAAVAIASAGRAAASSLASSLPLLTGLPRAGRGHGRGRGRGRGDFAAAATSDRDGEQDAASKRPRPPDASLLPDAASGQGSGRGAANKRPRAPAAPSPSSAGQRGRGCGEEALGCAPGPAPLAVARSPPLDLLAPSKLSKTSFGPSYVELTWTNNCTAGVKYSQVEFETEPAYKPRHRDVVRTKGSETRLLVTGLGPLDEQASKPKYRFRVQVANDEANTSEWSSWTRLWMLKQQRGLITQEVRRLTWSRFYPSAEDEDAGLPVKMPCLCCVVRKTWGQEATMLNPLAGPGQSNWQAGHVLPYSPYNIVGNEPDEAWNFVPICAECNQQMSNGHLIDYFTERAETVDSAHKTAIATNLVEILVRLRGGLISHDNQVVAKHDYLNISICKFAYEVYNVGVPGLGGTVLSESSGGAKGSIQKWIELAPNKKRCFLKAGQKGHDLQDWVWKVSGKAADVIALEVKKRIEHHDGMIKKLLNAAAYSHRELWSAADGDSIRDKKIMLESMTLGDESF